MSDTFSSAARAWKALTASWTIGADSSEKLRAAIRFAFLHLEQQLVVHAYGGKRRLELMRYVGKKGATRLLPLVSRLGLLGEPMRGLADLIGQAPQAPFGLLLRLQTVATLGDTRSDGGKTLHRAGRAPERQHGETGCSSPGQNDPHRYDDRQPIHGGEPRLEFGHDARLETVAAEDLSPAGA